MNCQDISRLVDAGGFDSLPDTQRREAEAHAMSCRRCAAVWAAHARLAQLQIPPMPAELALQCRTLAVLSAAPGRYPLRRLTLVGCGVALAAAAAVVAIHKSGTTGPAPGAVATAINTPAGPGVVAVGAAVPAIELAANPAAEEAEAPAAIGQVTAPAAPSKPVQLHPDETLPLVPLPVDPGMAARIALSDIALQNAAQRHPELVEGGETTDMFVVGVAIQPDGNVISSIVRATSPARSSEVDQQLSALLPSDSGGQSLTSRPKYTLLPDGHSLRANVLLRVSTVGAEYDITRSNTRVMESLGDRYSAYLRPASGQLNRLTVLLSDDGRIQKEKIDIAPPGGGTMIASDPNDVARMAQGFADRLDIDVAQIGLMGVTALQEGSVSRIVDADGSLRVDDQRRVMAIFYAWQRRPGESAASWGQKSGGGPKNDVDTTAVLALVERYLPDAFTLKDRAAGSATIVLTAEGKVIRAGRVQSRPGQPAQKVLEDQLAPGVQMGRFQMVRVKNAAGATADIDLAWERPKPQP